MGEDFFRARGMALGLGSYESKEVVSSQVI